MNYEECRTKAPVMNVPLLFLPNGLQTTGVTTVYSLNSHSNERAAPENRLNTSWRNKPTGVVGRKFLAPCMPFLTSLQGKALYPKRRPHEKDICVASPLFLPSLRLYPKHPA
jgi:hypothetical protein